MTTTTKAGFTPWHLDGVTVFDATLARVCEVDCSDDESETITGRGTCPRGQGRTNARLIAAAPDLYAACNAIANWFGPNEHTAACRVRVMGDGPCDCPFKLVREALAKAVNE